MTISRFLGRAAARPQAGIFGAENALQSAPIAGRRDEPGEGADRIVNLPEKVVEMRDLWHIVS